MKMFSQFRRLLAICMVVSVGLLIGCASKPIERDNDPIEGTNRSFYGFNDSLDKNVFVPVAKGYKKVMPKVVRSRVTDFFDNVSYVNVIVNDLLQGKVGQTISDTTRFLVNSTFGLGGLWDPATPMGLPKHAEDFGQTLASWGVAQGPYLVVPLHGSDTTRNLTDMVSSTFTNPLFYISGFAGVVTAPLAFLSAVNNRANLLEATKIRDAAAVDPYAFTREAFLQKREYEIYDGNPPSDEFDDIYGEGEEPGSVLKVF